MADSLSRRSFLAGMAGVAAFGRPRKLAGGQFVPTLALPPFLARPTADSILVTAHNGQVDATCRLEVKQAGPTAWIPVGRDRAAAAAEALRWDVTDLAAGSKYDYRILMAEPGAELEQAASGRFTTQRTGDAGFVAALSTDAHTGSFPEGTSPVAVLDDVVRNVAADEPEFMLALGDNVAWYGSRELAQEDAEGARSAYAMYRRHLAPLSPSCPHFGLIGNWEGESGKFPPQNSALMAAVRREMAPNPDEGTYPQGGSPGEDYYAFAWGPVLFVVLNVQSYSVPSGPLSTLRDDVSRIEDWTLGPTQRDWMQGVLSSSDHPFRFVCIHHVVGGNAGDAIETLYGRGGPRAAYVGEQALVHEMMADFGVQIFFLGHDHVFVDEVIDGIHYTIPGSCGAPWKFGTEVTGYRRFWDDSGHGRLTVRPDRARVEFVNQAGAVIHRFDVEPG